MHASIIIPVFNRAHLVARAIDSALRQTVPCEVLLVDHGSTDDVGTLACTYGDQIRYIRREFDNGPINCWRDGVEQAIGDFIHFTYDDDWIQPNFIEKCLSCFSEDVAFVYSRATLHTQDGGTATLLRHPAGLRPIEDIVQYLLTSPLTISPGCAVFRRSDTLKNLLTEVPGANGQYGKNSGVGEDLLLFLLTSLDYARYVHIPEPLADFLAHPGSITVNAQLTGRDQALADSYQVAKNFYLSYANAHPKATGLAAMVANLRWATRSRMK